MMGRGRVRRICLFLVLNRFYFHTYAKVMKIKEIVPDLNTFLKPSVFLHKETFFVSNKRRNRKVLYKMRTCEYLKIDNCPQ